MVMCAVAGGSLKTSLMYSQTHTFLLSVPEAIS
ncbi:hypothetical protein EBT16_07890 [bacterium]|nr:hypothetical protein [bacterium]